MRLVFVSSIFCLLCAAATRPDLHGRVTSIDGKAIPDAHVFMYTASVKIGTSPFCPSCYADCTKSATADVAGNFTITSLDPELLFKVLFVADGYAPKFVEKVDPLAGALSTKLNPLPPQNNPALELRGTLLDSQGHPVVGASVWPYGCTTAESRWWGQVNDVDPMSVTNTQGEFLFTCRKPVSALDLEVQARGFSDRTFPVMPLGRGAQRLVLTQGATLTGRLLQNGKPIGGISVGIVNKDSGVGEPSGRDQIATDANGRFTFYNVVPNVQMVVYGQMKSLAGIGASPAKIVPVGDDRTVADAGDILVTHGNVVAGRVILSDGKSLPANTRVLLSRDQAWDSQTTVADTNGRFSFHNVPAETVSLSLRVKDYHLSGANLSINLLNNGMFLEGIVDGRQNDMRIVLDPGPFPHIDSAARHASKPQSNSLQGVPDDFSAKTP